MRPNKYDNYKREARKLLELINNSPWRKQVKFSKPIWDGNYKVKWTIKNETHPKAEIARSLIYLIPSSVFSKRYSDYGNYLIETTKSCNWTISELEYNNLDESQKRFFTNQPFGYSPLLDRFGRKRYQMKMREFNLFYTPVIVRNRVKSEWIRIEEPDIRKYSEKLYSSGFGKKYFFVDHRPRLAEKIYNEKGKNRRQSRELKSIIDEGLDVYYNAVN